MDMHVNPPRAMADRKANGPGDEQAGLKDPVCGMAVTANSFHQLEHEGRPYYFCSASCKGKFTANPSAYTHSNPVDEAALGPPEAKLDAMATN